jgi:nucleotide-binding universal stress UspA family protein
MFEHILVPLDGSACSERALPVAAQIARATHGTLILVRAIPSTIEAAWYAMGSAPLMGEAMDAELKEVEAYLSGVAGASMLKGIKVTRHILTNRPAISILDAIHTLQADLVVMCSHGATGFRRWMLGSVTQEVIRHSPVPVLALRDGCSQPTDAYPDASRPFHSFTTVVALDGSRLAEEALVPAAILTAAIAAPARGGLHLTRVVKVPTPGEKQGLEPELREMALYEARYYLRELTDRLLEGPVADLNLTVSWSVAMGEDVAKTLIRVAEHGEDVRGVRVFGGYNMLAMTTHGRSGFPRLVLGSVTEQVLKTTRLPLFIVHASDLDTEIHTHRGTPEQTESRVSLR